jgi:1-acyl-sn-glycerol-3-phosphate acyltransferase
MTEPEDPGLAPGTRAGQADHRASSARPPDPAAPRLYRSLLVACRAIGRCLGLRLRLEGAEHLPCDPSGRPAGGWIAMGVPHRTWIDPFVLATLLPPEPRLVFLGDGRAIYRSRLRRWIFARIGGVVPIWPGSSRRAFAAHLEAARTVLSSGAVFALFPEVGPPVPVDHARPFGGGIGYFAVRSGAPVVPLVLGGTHELFLGRRIVLRVLPPVTARELVGDAADGSSEAWPPAADSIAERELAHAVTAALERRVAADVADCHRRVEPPPGARRPMRWLTHLFH